MILPAFSLAGWAWRAGAILLALSSVVLAVNRFADHYYDRGAADVTARYTEEALAASRQMRVEEREALQEAASALVDALALDRAWRGLQAEIFETAVVSVQEAVDAARSQFDEDTRCPAIADDVRVFNDAFAGGPGTEP